jgi:hypothetical protein
MFYATDSTDSYVNCEPRGSGYHGAANFEASDYVRVATFIFPGTDKRRVCLMDKVSIDASFNVEWTVIFDGFFRDGYPIYLRYAALNIGGKNSE